MAVFIGLDPGGDDKFGWAVVGKASRLPLPVLATGLARDARSAVKRAFSAMPYGESVVAAGINAPLIWSREGPRPCDTIVRKAIQRAGAPMPHGTVQYQNSVNGACLVQGILAARELRDRRRLLPITESHPKALRWLQPEARAIIANSEDERDAVLGAVAAWAMWSKQPRWRDLYADEHDSLWLVARPLYYFMPIV